MNEVVNNLNTVLASPVVEDHLEEVDAGVLDRLFSEKVVALELHMFDVSGAPTMTCGRSWTTTLTSRKPFARSSLKSPSDPLILTTV